MPIKGLLRRTALAYLEAKERRRSEPRKIIWLLGHMRSGSTLLLHLLGSHPDILAAGERNATYSNAGDLRGLAVAAAYARRQLFRDYGYVADQINHNRFLASKDLLDNPSLYKIFLIREPRGALASMVEILGRHYGMDLEQAVDYYLDRLEALERYARHVQDTGRSFFLTYGDLVERSRPALRRLQTFLDLETPIPETYRTFDFTGKQGDPSRRIRSGQIRGDLPPRQIDLDPRVLERARGAYSRCSGLLAAHCVTLTNDTPGSLHRPPGQAAATDRILPCRTSRPPPPP